MAALSDPRAFLSAQEKRAQQMKAMGIEETDINTKDLQGDDSGKQKGSKTAKAKPEEEKKGTFFLIFLYLFVYCSINVQTDMKVNTY